ncbi:hypothetical protein [uncultured Muriicola sp.]|uniref:hypothetical protein n=1 Tax=uncultured Muriicola sp. TaxID=1583102 RepID=UPI0026293EC9|nr:hypothetical protein [uncultured Muriicola sp.]
MAKNSVENKIREVLHERTMAPSENAWRKIEVQLGSHSEVKKKGYWAYGIAAGFIGILFVSIFFLSQPGAEVVPTQEVVNTGDTNLDVSNTLEIQESLSEHPENTSEMVHKDAMQDNRQLPNEVLVQSAGQPKFLDEKMVESFVTLEKVDTKIAEVMTQVAILEQNQGAISDATVDSLLRTAQKELLGERILGGSQSVDALALLSDVEDELNQSFRDQLFEKLKDGYVKVRSAIAYRNE